jgi:hypothetical protein
MTLKKLRKNVDSTYYSTFIEYNENETESDEYNQIPVINSSEWIKRIFMTLVVLSESTG